MEIKIRDFSSLTRSDFTLDYLSLSISSNFFQSTIDDLTQKIIGGAWRIKEHYSNILWHDSLPGLAIVAFANGKVHQLQFTSKAFCSPETFGLIKNILKFYDEHSVKVSVKRVDFCADIKGAVPADLFNGLQLNGDMFRRSGVTCSAINNRSTIYFNSRHKKIRFYDRSKSIAYKLEKGKEINLEEQNVLRSSAPITRFEVEQRGALCAEANASIRECVDEKELAIKLAAKFFQYNSMIDPETETLDPLWQWLKKDLAKRKRPKLLPSDSLIPLTPEEKLIRFGSSFNKKLELAGFTEGEKLGFFYRLVKGINTERVLLINEDMDYMDFDKLLDFYLKHGAQPEAEGR